MNVQIKISDLVYLLDPNMVVDQVARAIKAPAEKAGILMPAPVVGAGYMVWSLPGEGWTSLGDLSGDDRSDKASAIADRIASFKTLIGKPDLAEKIARVPDAKYLYFRTVGGVDQWAMVAWGYRYPDSHNGDELETWISRVKKQDVTMAFVWAGNPLANQSFTIRGIANRTRGDGQFNVGKVPVDADFAIEHKPSGRKFQLKVEAGRDRYDFDLTEYFKVEASVKGDGNPVNGERINVTFNGQSLQLTTDTAGFASGDLPLTCDERGVVAQSQPECAANCRDKRLADTPEEAARLVHFDFDFDTPAPPVPEPPKEEPAEPKMVTIILRDVLGTPIVNMPFNVKLKKKGSVQLTTDSEGKCVVPAEWFSHKEKMQFHFVMSREYHDAHGIELDKKALKKNRKTKS